MRLLITFLLFTIGLVSNAESERGETEILEEIFLLCQLSGREHRWDTGTTDELRGPATVRIRHLRIIFPDPKNTYEVTQIVIGKSGNPFFNVIDNTMGEDNSNQNGYDILWELNVEPGWNDREQISINRITGILDFSKNHNFLGSRTTTEFSGTCEKQTKTRF
ncbi:MAG: hypothetical protein P8N92_02680 [Burkholderiales bacterium]|nr:hypothetical protein [Burkholderiales bacterium]